MWLFTQDHNGSIGGAELDALIRDLYTKNNSVSISFVTLDKYTYFMGAIKISGKLFRFWEKKITARVSRVLLAS